MLRFVHNEPSSAHTPIALLVLSTCWTGLTLHEWPTGSAHLIERTNGLDNNIQAMYYFETYLIKVSK